MKRIFQSCTIAVAEPAVAAQDDAFGLWQIGDAFLADHLALNVVAVAAVDEHLAVDLHAALGRQHHDDRIVELRVRVVRVARASTWAET